MKCKGVPARAKGGSRKVENCKYIVSVSGIKHFYSSKYELFCDAIAGVV